MINNSLKYMKSKEKSPYTFYFIDDLRFKELVNRKILSGTDSKICTIGLIRDYDPEKQECFLVLENNSIKINISRIENFFKWNFNSHYKIFGMLKVKFQ